MFKSHTLALIQETIEAESLEEAEFEAHDIASNGSAI